MFNNFASTNRSVEQFNYANLNGIETQELLSATAILFDRVFDIEDNLFERHIIANSIDSVNEPSALFDRYFAGIEELEMTKYQRNFIKFAKANLESILRWYHINGKRVNISPKQVEWFKRWFAKHGVPHAFLDKHLTKAVV